MSSQLFSPASLGDLALPNRIVIPPMCQYSAEDGLATDWHLMHYGALSHSGAGMLIIEATAVVPEGRITQHDLGIWSDATANALGRLVESIRKYSEIPLALQLAHAGRKASQFAPWVREGVVPQHTGGWIPEAPSPLVYSYGSASGVVPREMDAADCLRIRNAFAEAARRAGEIGFDAVEVHMAHGYLLHEFLSPIANIRLDKYGGRVESRMRFPLEVFDAVREAFPGNRPVGVRISGSDWVESGWDIEKSCGLALALQQKDCAYIHVSGGGLTPEQQISPGPGYQVEMAATVKKSLAKARHGSGSEPMPVIAVGLITEPHQAESILRSGQADLVAVGRRILYDNHWPWRAAVALGGMVSAPPQYWRSAPHGVRALFRKQF